MEYKVQEILNSYILGGRDPRYMGLQKTRIILYKGSESGHIRLPGIDIVKNFRWRELVSLESGLWQFACEKNLVLKQGFELRHEKPFGKDYIDYYFEYRIMLSSIQEDVLKFMEENLLQLKN